MEREIAVIGGSDSIGYFRLLGFETYETRAGILTQNQLEEIERKSYKIIFVTEEVYRRYGPVIEHGRDRVFPVVSIIPDLRSAIWTDRGPLPGRIALEEIRKAVVKAVGQDIASR